MLNSHFFSVEFCMKYSYNHNGPCKNGGELINSNDLAINAKCSCKADYSGDFCDIVRKVCNLNTAVKLLPYRSWLKIHWLYACIYAKFRKFLSQTKYISTYKQQSKERSTVHRYTSANKFASPTPPPPKKKMTSNFIFEITCQWMKYFWSYHFPILICGFISGNRLHWKRTRFSRRSSGLHKTIHSLQWPSLLPPDTWQPYTICMWYKNKRYRYIYLKLKINLFNKLFTEVGEFSII